MNTTAGNKAFLVNRVGDAGFVLGIFALFTALDAAGQGTVVFREIQHHVASLDGRVLWGVPVVTLATLLLFVGAIGKSAQIPLHVWLPDAMQGPTPVSALIHAATMVTAGVYMIARLHFLYALAPATLAVIAGIGAATALGAATVGLVQNDIKRVLAYSTVSQLGYMFLAMGVGAWSAGVFHLVTHAFFKACLFLGAGSVIHALHHEQDMRKMGGLRAALPVTFWTFLSRRWRSPARPSRPGSSRRTRSSGRRGRALTAARSTGWSASPRRGSRPATCSARCSWCSSGRAGSTLPSQRTYTSRRRR